LQAGNRAQSERVIGSVCEQRQKGKLRPSVSIAEGDRIERT
jgi:hypothetical protein